MEVESSLPRLQLPATCPYLEPARSNPYSHPSRFLKINFNIYTHTYTHTHTHTHTHAHTLTHTLTHTHILTLTHIHNHSHTHAHTHTHTHTHKHTHSHSQAPYTPSTKSHVPFPLFRSYQSINPGPRHNYLFGNNASFYGDELLETRPNPKMKDHTFSAVRHCLLNIFAAPVRTGSRSSNRNLRTRLPW